MNPGYLYYYSDSFTYAYLWKDVLISSKFKLQLRI